MVSNYNANVNVNFKINSASSKAVVNAFTKELGAQKINLPVNLQFKNINVKDVSRQNASFRQLTNTITALGTSSSKSAAHLNSLYNAIRHVGSSLNNFGSARGLQVFNNNVNKSTKILQTMGHTTNQMRKNFIGFSESVGISARRFLSFGVAAAVLAKTSYEIRNATVAALEFDREMVRLRQVSRDSDTMIASIARTISKLGINMGVSSSEMAKTAVTLRQAGLSARETAKALEVLGKTTLSPTFEDLHSTTEGLIALFNQFDKNINNLEGHFSAISKVSADFAVESSDLVEALKRTGGAFKAAGGNVNELLAMYTTIRQTTRESSESIATGMRTILARLEDPVIARKLHNIGVEVYDLKGQFVGPYEAIERLGAALRKLPQGDIRASQILKDIGGLRQLSRVIPLIYNNDITTEALQSANNSAGKLTEDAQMAQKAILVQLDRIKEGFLDLFRVISTDSSVRAALTGIASLIEGVADALRQVKPLIPVLLAFGALKTITSVAGGFQSFKRGLIAPAKGYAEGGYVTGGTPGKDSVRAMLMPGEYVFSKPAVDRIGKQNVEHLHHMASGGKALDPEIHEYKAMGGLVPDRKKNAGVRKYVNTLLRSPVGRDIYKVIRGSQYLGSGAEAVAFKSPKGSVFRLSGQPVDRIDSPFMIQPTAVHKIGQHTIEELPFVTPLKDIKGKTKKSKNINNDVFGNVEFAPENAKTRLLTKFSKRITSHGYIRGDMHIGNVGLYQGKLIALDPGTFTNKKEGLTNQVFSGISDLGIKAYANGGGLIGSSLPRRNRWERSRLADLFRGKEGRDTYKYLKSRGATYLDAGAEATVFKSKEGTVLRIATADSYRERINSPYMLQPTAIHRLGHVAEELPFAPPIKKTIKPKQYDRFNREAYKEEQERIDKRLAWIENAFDKRLHSKGYLGTDVHTGNIARVGKKIMAIDPGTFRKMPDELNKNRKNFLKILGFAKGGSVIDDRLISTQSGHLAKKLKHSGKYYQLEDLLVTNGRFQPQGSIGQKTRLRRIEVDPESGQLTARSKWYAQHRQNRFLKKFAEGGFIEGYRGVSKDELRELARIHREGGSYTSPKYGEIFFADRNIKPENYHGIHEVHNVISDQEYSPKRFAGLLATLPKDKSDDFYGKRGYVFKLNIPENQTQKPKNHDVGFRTTPHILPHYVESITSSKKIFRDNSDIIKDNIPFDLQYGKTKDASKFIQRYNRMFYKKPKGFARGGRVDILQRSLDASGIDLNASNFVRGVHFGGRGVPKGSAGAFYPGSGLIAVQDKFKTSTLLHEFGHALDFGLSPELYLGASSIKEKDNPFRKFAKRFQQYAPPWYDNREYFTSNNIESFAEAFANHTLHKQGLKSPRLSYIDWSALKSDKYFKNASKIFENEILPIAKQYQDKVKFVKYGDNRWNAEEAKLFKTKGFADGGTVGFSLKDIFKGAAKGTDTVPAMLTPGEFVVNREAAQKFGYENLKAINNRQYRMNRRRNRFSGDSLYDYNSIADQLAHTQAAYAARKYRLSGDYRLSTSPNFFKQYTISHKRHLRNIINEHRLRDAGKGATPYSLANASFILGKRPWPENRISPSTPAKLSTGGEATTDYAYMAHGGVVGKDLNIDILKDYLKKAGINIDVDKFVKGVKYDPKLKSAGRFTPDRMLTMGPKAKIATLLHEFGHAIDYDENAQGPFHFHSSFPGNKNYDIAMKYLNIPGVESKSIYGNGGLNAYKPEQYGEEGFANAFAAWALQKGLTKKEISENFPHFEQQQKGSQAKKTIQAVGRSLQKQVASPPRKPPRKPPVATAASPPPPPSPEPWPPRSIVPSWMRRKGDNLKKQGYNIVHSKEPESKFIPFNPYNNPAYGQRGGEPLKNEPVIQAAPPPSNLLNVKPEVTPATIQNITTKKPSAITYKPLAGKLDLRPAPGSGMQPRTIQPHNISPSHKSFPGFTPEGIKSLYAEGGTDQSGRLLPGYQVGQYSNIMGLPPIDSDIESKPRVKSRETWQRRLRSQQLRQQRLRTNPREPDMFIASPNGIEHIKKETNAFQVSSSGVVTVPKGYTATRGLSSPLPIPGANYHPGQAALNQGQEIFGYAKQERASQIIGKSRLADSKMNARRFAQMNKEYGNMTFDIKNLDKTSTGFFSGTQKWLGGFHKKLLSLDKRFKQAVSGLSSDKYNNMHPEERSTHIQGRLFKAQIGLGIASALIPQVTEHIFGNAKQPRLGGRSGARTGAIVGGLLSGATGGAAAGAMFGPAGIAVGAFIGATTNAVGALKDFDEQVKQINLEKFSSTLSKVNFNERTGQFRTTGDQDLFIDALNKIIPDANESRNIHNNNLNIAQRFGEEYQNSGIGISSISTLFGANNTKAGSAHETIKGLDEERRNVLSDTAFDLYKRIGTSNPNLRPNQVINEANKVFKKNNLGVGVEDVFTPETAKAAKAFTEGLNKTADIQKRFSDLLSQSNQEMGVAVSQIEKFNEGLQVGTEQFAKRTHYTEMTGAALQGHIIASPNDINIGAFGDKNSLPGQLHAFSKTGGGYDQAKQQLVNLLQTEGMKTIAGLKPEDIEKEDTRISTEVASKFKLSGAGGSYNNQIGNHLEGMLGHIQDLPEKIRNNPSALADQLLEKFHPIKEGGLAATKQVQEAYGIEQQRSVALANRQFGLNQQAAEHNVAVGEFSASRAAQREMENPNQTGTSRVVGLRTRTLNQAEYTRAGYILKGLQKGTGISDRNVRLAQRIHAVPILERSFMSPEQRALEASTAEHQQAFQNARNQFQGGGLNVEQLHKGVHKQENKLSNLITQRNAAANGPALADVKAIQDQIATIDKERFEKRKLGIHVPFNDKRTEALHKQMDNLYKNSGGDKLRDLDKQILATQVTMRDYNEQLKLLANNTSSLEDAQKKYEMAQQKVSADMESRKRDADVLAFGSHGDKMNLMMRENITQQALSLGQDQFSNLPDQIKKIVYERLQETEGMNRQIQSYDKYGRENGVTNVTGEQALNYFRQPYQQYLNNSDPAKFLQKQRDQAGSQLDRIAKEKFAAGSTQLGLNQESINKQTIQGEDSYQKFLQGINKSIADQMAATQNFLAGSAELTKALNNFQGKLTVERNGKVEVVLNGVSLLQNMKGDLEKEITETIIAKLQETIKKEIKNQPAR